MNAEDTDYNKQIDALLDKIQDVLEGERMEVVMTALLALVGHAGFYRYSNLSKQELIAYSVNTIEQYYEKAKKEFDNG